MNNKKNPLIDESEVAADGLDQAGHEVAHISDMSLASQFLMHNKEAKSNTKATISKTDLEEEKEIEVEAIEIDQAIKEKTLADVASKEIDKKQLLSENHKKEFWLSKWNAVKSFFNWKKNQEVYYEHFNYQFMSADWKMHDQAKKLNYRKNEIMYNDFLSYSDLQLRNNKVLKKIWFAEGFFSVLAIFLAIVYILLATLVPIAFSGSNNSNILGTLEAYKKVIYAFSVLSIIAIIVPYFFLSSTWFVGINQVFRSKFFHYFLISILILAYVFLFISFVFVLTYFSYSWNIWVPS